MIVIEFKEFHFVPAVRTFQGIITKRQQDSSPPLVETSVNVMFFF